MQIQTSTRDPYRKENHALDRALENRGGSPELRESFGAHTGSWMREIGSLETLLWQDRRLGFAS